MSKSTEIFVFFKFIYLFFFGFYIRVIYVYVSSLLLSSENIYWIWPCSLGTQWDLSSLLFAVWMFFSWLWVLYWGHTLFFLVCFSPHDIFCRCVFVCVCVGVVLGFTNCYFFFALCVWVCVLGIFCVCVAVKQDGNIHIYNTYVRTKQTNKWINEKNANLFLE